MFSERLPAIIRMTEKIGQFPPLPARELADLLAKGVRKGALTTEELVEILNGTREAKNRDLIKEFSVAYQRPHDREILLLPPLYFSSRCENRCLYCDFSNQGLRLSLDEFRDEFSTLLKLGFRSIELVSSQDPELYLKPSDFALDKQRFDVGAAAAYFILAKELLSSFGGGMLTSNIPPVDGASFERLRAAGLDCFLVWQETFHPGQYERLHNRRGPKAHQAFRLDSFERASRAGIRHQAGAFLKGLFDWRREEVVLYELDRYLKEISGRSFSIIGTPRLKGDFLKSPLVAPYEVSDEDYELNIALDRILFDGILWLQTREPFDLNRRLIGRYGGGVILTLISSTAPGGYSKPAAARAQFPVHKQDLSQSVKELEDDGFQVVFDWTGQTLTDFQRETGQNGGG